MSYFLFGVVRLSDEAQEYDDELSWKLVEAGVASRLFVLVGHNVWQQPVLDMLRERGMIGHRFVSVMITKSPMCNTSHELISPYPGSDWDLTEARDAWYRIGRWSERVYQIPGVHEIQLFTSLAYSSTFVDVEALPAKLAEVIIGQIESAEDLPAMRIRLLPGAPDVPATSSTQEG